MDYPKQGSMILTCRGTLLSWKLDVSLSMSPEESGPVPCTIVACARLITAAGTHTRTYARGGP